jgi:hypothetical protein
VEILRGNRDRPGVSIPDGKPVEVAQACVQLAEVIAGGHDLEVVVRTGGLTEVQFDRPTAGDRPPAGERGEASGDLLGTPRVPGGELGYEARQLSDGSGGISESTA